MIYDLLDWCLEKLPKILLKITFILIFIVIGIQIEIWKHRQEESKDLVELQRIVDWNRIVIQQFGSRIKLLEEQIEILKKVNQIIDCESEGKHYNIWGDGGKAYGIAQFHKATFYELAKKAGMKKVNWKNREHQIKLLRWSVKNGYGEKWSCF